MEVLLRFRARVTPKVPDYSRSRSPARSEFACKCVNDLIARLQTVQCLRPEFGGLEFITTHLLNRLKPRGGLEGVLTALGVTRESFTFPTRKKPGKIEPRQELS